MTGGGPCRASSVVLEFLVRGGHLESARAFEKSSGTSAFGQLGEELDFLRDLVLDGEWRDVESSLKLLEEQSGFVTHVGSGCVSPGAQLNCPRALFLVRRQRLLELIEHDPSASFSTGGTSLNEGGLSKTLGTLWASVQEAALDFVGSDTELAVLRRCLAAMSVREQLPRWSPARGRYECVDALLEACGFRALLPRQLLAQYAIRAFNPRLMAVPELFCLLEERHKQEQQQQQQHQYTSNTHAEGLSGSGLQGTPTVIINVNGPGQVSSSVPDAIACEKEQPVFLKQEKPSWQEAAPKMSRDTVCHSAKSPRPAIAFDVLLNETKATNETLVSPVPCNVARAAEGTHDHEAALHVDQEKEEKTASNDEAHAPFATVDELEEKLDLTRQGTQEKRQEEMGEETRNDDGDSAKPGEANRQESELKALIGSLAAEVEELKRQREQVHTGRKTRQLEHEQEQENEPENEQEYGEQEENEQGAEEFFIRNGGDEAMGPPPPLEHGDEAMPPEEREDEEEEEEVNVSPVVEDLKNHQGTIEERSATTRQGFVQGKKQEEESKHDFVGNGREEKQSEHDFVGDKQEKGDSWEEMRSPEKHGIVGTFHPVVCFLQDAQPVRSIAFDPDGEKLAMGTNSRSIAVSGLPAAMGALARSAPSLVSTMHDGYAVNVYDTVEPPRLRLHSAPGRLSVNKAHLGSVYCLDWNKNEANTLLASGSNDKLVKIWSPGDNELCPVGALSDMRSTVRSVKFLRHQGTLMLAAVGGGDNGVRVWDVASKTLVSTLCAHSDTVFGLDAIDSSSLVTSGADGMVRLWDLRVPGSKASIATMTARKGGGVHCVRWSQGGTLASGHENGSVCIWDVKMQRVSSCFEHHSGDVRDLDFSRDGSWLLSGSFDGTVGVIDLDPFHACTAATFSAHVGKVLQCKWHPTLPYFCTAASDGTVKGWAMPLRPPLV